MKTVLLTGGTGGLGRALAEEVRAANEQLDLLINNAGIGFGPPGARRELSRDGFELRFAVNYLAPFLLTHSCCRDGYRAYGQSKLALIMLTFDLADALKASDVTANAIHPATLMPTRMVEESGMAPQSTVDEGADAVEHLACSPELAGTSLCASGFAA